MNRTLIALLIVGAGFRYAHAQGDFSSMPWKSITPGPGGWVTACAIDPTDANRVLVGGDVLGATISSDGGITWEHTVGFEMSEMESFLIAPAPVSSGFRFFAATMGGVYGSNDGVVWTENVASGWPALSEDIISRPVAALSLVGQTLYAGAGSVRMGVPGEISADSIGGIYKVDFAAASPMWQEVAAPRSITGGDVNIQHISARAQPGALPDRLFVSLRRNGLWRSIDGGSQWQKMVLPGSGGADQSFMSVSHPTDPDIVYIAAGDDGIYKTEDGGDTWAKKSPCTSQVIAISDADPDVLYAGCYPGSSHGVVKTVDGGESWTQILNAQSLPSLPNDHGTSNIRYHAIAAAPQDPNRAIIGTDVNLYVTADGGTTWQSSGGSSLDGGSTWTGTDFSGICGESIILDRNDSSHFLLGSADGGLWETWNRGVTFSRRVPDSLGPPGVDPGEVFTDFQDGARSLQDADTIYIVGDVVKNDSGPLFKTLDGGQSWSQIHAGPFRSVEVHLDDHDVVLAVTASGSISRSVNGGQTFSPTGGATNIRARRLSAHPLSHDTFYCTSGQGVYRSVDAGVTWSSIGGPQVWGMFGSVAVDPTDPSVLFATSFSGVSKYDGTTWSQVLGVTRASDVTVTSGGVVFAATTAFPTHDKDPDTTGVWRSHDQGATWSFDIDRLRIRRVTVIEAHPTDASLVVAGTDCGGFFIKADAADSMAPAPPGGLGIQ